MTLRNQNLEFINLNCSFLNLKTEHQIAAWKTGFGKSIQDIQGLMRHLCTSTQKDNCFHLQKYFWSCCTVEINAV